MNVSFVHRSFSGRLARSVAIAPHGCRCRCQLPYIAYMPVVGVGEVCANLALSVDVHSESTFLCAPATLFIRRCIHLLIVCLFLLNQLLKGRFIYSFGGVGVGGGRRVSRKVD